MRVYSQRHRWRPPGKKVDLDDWLFVRADELPFDRHKLLKVFRRIGARSGVRGVNIHRFRHTFAV
ncbi:hypothetical protein ACFLXI_05475 [Chloroflexota bacterium]